MSASSWRVCKKVHPAADIFPLMAADELRKLADDIVEADGLRLPIQTRTAEDGKLYVIDGRNRLDACELLGWKLVNDKGGWHGKITAHIEHKRRNHSEIVAEVIGYNIRRRHLTKEQQVELIDAALRMTSPSMARSFSPVAGKKGGSTKDEHKAAVVAEAAKVGISERTVERTLAKTSPATPKPDEQNVSARKPRPQPDAIERIDKALNRIINEVEEIQPPQSEFGKVLIYVGKQLIKRGERLRMMKGDKS